MALSKPRVIVGLDFGTTFSGFAYAHISDLNDVFTFYNYPKAAGEKPYCKTLTGSYYKKVGGVWQFKSWGYPARAEYAKDIQEVRKQRASGPSNDPFPPSVGTYFTKFKLHLASRDMGSSSAQQLPQGLTVNVLITDYLREMGALVLKTLQEHFGSQLSKQAIQWCITVPSIWDNAAKASMKTCMASAGLVDGVDGSRHPLIMVLEPEAASICCHKVMSSEEALKVGEKLLVADIGGGTSDIVVQEVVSVGESSYKVREVTTSSGGLCGGTHVDARFMEFMHRKIGPCLQDCINQQLKIYAQLIEEWERKKASFGDRMSIGETTDINLLGNVATKWEEYDRRMSILVRDSYDDLEISYQEMQSIFDPIVEQNLELIANQLNQLGPGDVKVLVVVGGFAGSPYLMDCIRKRFTSIVPHIISPRDPGSAVCQGAVMLALHPETVLSRVCKKTYGIGVCEDFRDNIDSLKFRKQYNGVWKCENLFSIFVRKGDKVDVNSCISKSFYPTALGQKSILIELFSSDETDPKYTVGGSARKEGEIKIDISKDMTLERSREVKESIFFGDSCLVVKAEAVNFSAGGLQQLELPVEVGFC